MTNHSPFLLFVFIAILGACAPAPTQAPPQSPSLTAPVLSSLPPTVPTPSASTAAASPAPANPSSTARPTWSDQDPVGTWFAAHGIDDTSAASLLRLASLPDSRDLQCDSIVPVGKPIEHAALCRREQIESQWVQVTSYLLLVAEQGKLRVLWEVPSAVGKLSKQDMSEEAYAQVNVSMRDDGLELVLEDGAVPCTDAAKRLAEAKKTAEAEDSQVFAAIAPLIRRVCQGKGRYVWRGGKYVRGSAAP